MTELFGYVIATGIFKGGMWAVLIMLALAIATSLLVVLMLFAKHSHTRQRKRQQRLAMIVELKQQARKLQNDLNHRR